MKPIAVAILCLLVPSGFSAGSAAAQAYQTALPLDGAERRAVEIRLSTILENAEPDQIARFALPTGRRITVRPYRPVRGNRGEPCRGYRIDLEDRAGMLAVDGFRCLSTGRAWVITEPETVVAQEGDPLDLRVERTERTERRAGSEAEIGADDPFGRIPFDVAKPSLGEPDAFSVDDGSSTPRRTVLEPDERAPIPRRAPIRVAEAPSPDPLFGDEPPTEGRAALTGLVAEALDRADDELVDAPDPATPATTVIVQDEPPAALDPPQPLPQETEVAAFDPDPAPDSGARVVELGAPAADAGLIGYARDPRIVEGLRDLAYLGGGRPTEDAVRQAVDEFSRDERFALPVSADDLAARLVEATSRNRGLPPCPAPSQGDPCLAP